MDYDPFFRGFISEMRKLGEETRSVEQIAKGKPARMNLPEGREPAKEDLRRADAAA